MKRVADRSDFERSLLESMTLNENSRSRINRRDFLGSRFQRARSTHFVGAHAMSLSNFELESCEQFHDHFGHTHITWPTCLDIPTSIGNDQSHSLFIFKGAETKRVRTSRICRYLGRSESTELLLKGTLKCEA